MQRVNNRQGRAVGDSSFGALQRLEHAVGSRHTSHDEDEHSSHAEMLRRGAAHAPDEAFPSVQRMPDLTLPVVVSSDEA